MVILFQCPRTPPRHYSAHLKLDDLTYIFSDLILSFCCLLSYITSSTIMNKRHLPPEIISTVLSYTDTHTINTSVASIPFLCSLITLTFTDAPELPTDGGNYISTREILKTQLPLDPLIMRYRLFKVIITSMDDEKLYLVMHRLLARLIKHTKPIEVTYFPDTIDMTHLKMFKSLFHDKSHSLCHYHVSFPNISAIKTNANHLLMSGIVAYPALVTLNLYYCSSKFYSDVLQYCDLSRHPHTLPQLLHLKLRDYMNEDEDVYSMHSNNYIPCYGDDYDDYDHNSDLDENEFYFDGLEIIQNFTLTKIQSLVLKNCNVSTLKNVKAPQLHTLKLMELSNKHIEAFDLNLIDGDHQATRYRSFLGSSISTSCSITKNSFPTLQCFKIVGHIRLKQFSANVLGVREVIVKGCNIDLETRQLFMDKYGASNTLII